MKHALRIAMTLAAAFGPFAAANAADYDPPIVVDDAPEYVPVEVGSGWYLRGDVGYAADASISGADYRTFDPILASYGAASFATAEIDKNITAGLGFGYRYTEFLRADATLEGFRAKFDGTTTAAAPCSPDVAFVGTTCRSEDGAEFSAVSAMVNGYLDLGTYVGVTPYVGAGAGYSFVSWGDLGSRNFCVGATCPAPGGPVSTSVNAGEDGWLFTYALMAGFAYDLPNNFKLDLGYKFRHIETGDMFAWNAASAAAGATGVQGTHGDIEQHEFKVGLRYELW